MNTIRFTPFMDFCKGLVGQTLPTKGGNAKFILLSVKNDTLYYLVESTQNERHSNKKWIEKVLNHYALTGSLRTVDYVRITTNASYTLKLIELYLQSLPKNPKSKMNREPRFWLISPKVWGVESEVADWKGIIISKPSAAFLGWKPTDKQNSMGPRFAQEVQVGDTILIARMFNKGVDMVGFGTVSSNADNVTRLGHAVQRRELYPFLRINAAPPSVPLNKVVNIRRAFCEKKLTLPNNKQVYDWIVSKLNAKTKRGPRRATNLLQQGIKLIDIPSNSTYGYTYTTNLKKEAEKAKMFRKKERKLQDEYETWLKNHGHGLNALVFPCRLQCDLWENDRRNLIEAKATIRREDIRMAVGQLLDYSHQCIGDVRFQNPNKAILLPRCPPNNIISWIESVGIKIIWKQNKEFLDNANNQFV
jgi:hypothetical protein